MIHIAILSKEGNLLEKIILGEKTIESRWYVRKYAPYKRIKEDEIIYFKETGGLITAKARVEKALFYENLTQEKVKNLLEQYHKQLGVDMRYYEKIKDKTYCTLIFLKDVEKVKPFKFDKTGYAMMSAWITIDDQQMELFS
jgi:hypothetical protein